MSMRDGRPTFYYNNDPDMRIRAAGLLVYRFTKGMTEPEYLMIKYKGRYEDFGGKTDIVDSCIDDTVIRETDEESNGVLNSDSISNKIKNSKPVYCHWSKYLVHIIKINKKYESDVFGDRELHDNIPRTVEWVKHSHIWKNRYSKDFLHMRLQFDGLFARLIKIYNKCVGGKAVYVKPKNRIRYHKCSNKKRDGYMFI